MRHRGTACKPGLLCRMFATYVVDYGFCIWVRRDWPGMTAVLFGRARMRKEMYMKNKIARRGFTLVELLIGVLVIGILASVAVPQYQKAVLKSQFSTLLPLAKNLWEGNEIFYLNNGEYAAGINELDVSAPTDPKVQTMLGDEEKHQYVRVSKADIPNRVTMYQKNSPNFPQETHCEALVEDPRANWLCKDSMGGTYVGQKFGYNIYSLSDQVVGTLGREYYNDPPETRLLDMGDSCTADRNRGCFNIHYNNASCEVKEGLTLGGCYQSAFGNHSVCTSNGIHGCDLSSFSDYSECVGNGEYACNSNSFKNYSVCYANITSTCQSSYDATSYCVSEKGLCPVGSPKQDGSRWAQCEEGIEGRISC